MAGVDNRLRILFIAGGLGQGGAEKQFLYMLRALKKLDGQVQVLTLTDDESHQENLSGLGILPIFLGSENPARRVARIIKTARAFRPHFIQATHFFASFYAGLSGRLCGQTSIGAIRGDLYHDLAGVGMAGKWVLRLPDILLANSNNARRNALDMGLPETRLAVLPNVIDLNAFERQALTTPNLFFSPDHIHVVTVARLIPVKRLERFIQALAIARAQVPELEGIIIGDGSEMGRLKAFASGLGLDPGQQGSGLAFAGKQGQVPALLNQAELFVLTSDREGFPNVVLEAMAASLPVISTPAGEVREIIHDGENGYLIPFDDPQALAHRMIELARSPALRRLLGNAGRRAVEERFNDARLPDYLMEVYQSIARKTGNREAGLILEKQAPVNSRTAYTG